MEQRIREIISTKFEKRAIRENFDPRNISAIRYKHEYTHYFMFTCTSYVHKHIYIVDMRSKNVSKCTVTFE